MRPIKRCGWNRAATRENWTADIEVVDGSDHGANCDTEDKETKHSARSRFLQSRAAIRPAFRHDFTVVPADRGERGRDKWVPSCVCLGFCTEFLNVRFTRKRSFTSAPPSVRFAPKADIQAWGGWRASSAFSDGVRSSWAARANCAFASSFLPA
jgi:hypothetical protein